jgi:hypothetical protein
MEQLRTQPATVFKNRAQELGRGVGGIRRAEGCNRRRVVHRSGADANRPSAPGP